MTKTPKDQATSRRALLAALAGAAVFLAALGAGWYVYVVKARQEAKTSIQPTEAPSASATEEVIDPSASPTPSATPTSSVSASPSATSSAASSLPDTVKAQVANFYVAYTAQDRERLGALFSEDADATTKELHSLLFTGADSRGIPGGPTLFSSSAVSEHPTSYTITSSAQSGNAWVVTVLEVRVSGTGETLPSQTTVLTFVPAPAGTNTWVLSSYVHPGSTDKYNGFFTQ